MHKEYVYFSTLFSLDMSPGKKYEALRENTTH